jgi:predicted acyl esterase
VPKVRLWYDRKMPADWKASEAEWEWFCFQTKGRLVDEARKLDEGREARAADAEKRGPTAGWRAEKRAEPSLPDSLPRGTVRR